MQKCSIKFSQIEPKDTSKHSSPWSSRLHARFHQHNPLLKQTQRKKKTHDHLIRCWKSLWHNITPIYVKYLSKFRIQGTYLNIIKVIYSKLTTNIKLNGKRFDTIPLISETRQGYPFSPYLIFLVLEVLDKTNRQQKRLKEYNTEGKKSRYHYLQMT